MPYEIHFSNPEEKRSFDAWYVGIKPLYPDREKLDAVVKEELEKRGLTARSECLGTPSDTTAASHVGTKTSKSEYVRCPK